MPTKEYECQLRKPSGIRRVIDVFMLNDKAQPIKSKILSPHKKDALDIRFECAESETVWMVLLEGERAHLYKVLLNDPEPLPVTEKGSFDGSFMQLGWSCSCTADPDVPQEIIDSVCECFLF